MGLRCCMGGKGALGTRYSEANDVLKIEGSHKVLLHESIKVLYCTWK